MVNTSRVMQFLTIINGKRCASGGLKGELHGLQLLLACAGNGLQAAADLRIYLLKVRQVRLPAGQQLKEAFGQLDANWEAVAHGQACRYMYTCFH